MNGIIHQIDSPNYLTSAAQRLRRMTQESGLLPETILELFEKWAGALADRDLSQIPGVTFLRLWLRRGNLEPILSRELGSNSLGDQWREDGSARLRAFPLGVVGHWPAANVEIQPVLSLTCALLGGNTCLVRVPSGLVEITRLLMEKLREVDSSGVVHERVFLASFDHSRKDLQEAMAQSVDGAMIWEERKQYRKFGRFRFPIGRGSRFSARACRRPPWMLVHGEAMICAVPGARESPAMSGNLTSKPAPPRKRCFLNEVIATRRSSPKI